MEPRAARTQDTQVVDEEKGLGTAVGSPSPRGESTRGAVNRSQSLDMDAEDIDAISSNLIQVSPFTTPVTPKNRGGPLLAMKNHNNEKGTVLSRELNKGDGVLMLEITSDGQQSFKNMRLRELLEYVNAEARRLDKESGGYGVGKQQKDKIIREGSLDNLSQAVEGATEFSTASPTYCSAANPLRLRDLRRLEARYDGSEESTILVRWHAILISLDPIMAVVMSSRVILLVPDGADSLLALVEDHLMLWVESDIMETPFEVHAYDALLTTVSSLLSREYSRFESNVNDTLSLFSKKGLILSVDAQETMRSLKNQASRMLNRIASFRRALEDLVEDDEDMALMNLTLLKSKPRLYQYPLSSEILGLHEEIEELLENYLNDYNGIESKLFYQKQQMQSAEELLRIRLDSARNTLLLVNTQFGILACAIAFGSFCVSGFGMNLITDLNSIPGLFSTVFALSFAVIVLLFAVVVLYLRTSGTLPISSTA